MRATTSLHQSSVWTADRVRGTGDDPAQQSGVRLSPPYRCLMHLVHMGLRFWCAEVCARGLTERFRHRCIWIAGAQPGEATLSGSAGSPEGSIDNRLAPSVHNGIYALMVKQPGGKSLHVLGIREFSHMNGHRLVTGPSQSRLIGNDRIITASIHGCVGKWKSDAPRLAAMRGLFVCGASKLAIKNPPKRVSGGVVCTHGAPASSKFRLGSTAASCSAAINSTLQIGPAATRVDQRRSCEATPHTIRHGG